MKFRNIIKGLIIIRFIKNPNLPESKVTLIAVSEEYLAIIDELERLGIGYIPIPKAAFLPPPVCSHADMLIHHLGDNQMICASSISHLLLNHQFNITISNPVNAKYPNDILLNSLRIGDLLFGKINAVSQHIIEYCKNQTIQIIHVNQGYTKCSTAVINEKAIVTSDITIADAGKKAGLDVLQIQPGYIELQGYNYGFIGGCCGLIDQKTLAVTGKIKTHPDGNDMRQFAKNHGVDIIELDAGNLKDVGGIIPLKKNRKFVDCTSPGSGQIETREKTF